MAEIDDTISNQPISDDAFLEQEVSTPNEEIESSEGAEVTMDEEGGAEIDFDPNLLSGTESDEHFSNLAEIMDDQDLDELGSTLYDQYTEYKNAMFERTNTKNSPWKIIRANRKTEARVNVINHILQSIPYDKELEI